MERYVSQFVIFFLSALATVSLSTAKSVMAHSLDHDYILYNFKAFFIVIMFTAWIPMIPARIIGSEFKFDRLLVISILSIYLGYEVVYRGFRWGGFC